MRKRIFSILLTIAVCLSMMPAGVWANEGNIPEKGTDNLFKINTVEEFKTFQNKVNRGDNDKVVTLSTNSNENEVSTENEHTNHCVCSGTANVNGHSHDTAGTVWTATNSLPASAGNYYLTQSVSGNWTVPTGDVKLCLNGQTISGKITVGGGVYVGEKCSFTMDGGNITVNTATAGNGGGIYIHNLATKAEISNALITNNKATATGNVSFGLGGGIYSQKNLTVNNSAITGNEATYYGGGICGAGSITLNSTVVTGNKSTKGNGGGMYTSKMSSTSVTNQPLSISGSTQIKDNAPNNYHVNEARQLPINVTAALTDSAVIYVDVYEGLKPDYNSTLTIAEPKSGVTLDASNFKADAADCVTGVDENGKVYLALCEHKMGNTGYTCEK